jgi:SepF-like predicted cell division protein (DUF552 family)
MVLWGKKEQEEYIELNESGEERPQKIPIQIDKMEDYTDSDRIQRKVRDGIILLVRIKGLREKNIGELRRAIDRIKRTCDALGGDVVGVGEDWLIVAPSFAKIERN